MSSPLSHWTVTACSQREVSQAFSWPLVPQKSAQVWGAANQDRVLINSDAYPPGQLVTLFLPSVKGTDSGLPSSFVVQTKRPNFLSSDVLKPVHNFRVRSGKCSLYRWPDKHMCRVLGE